MNQPVERLYTYGFAHMSVRDQVVFKSIIGLLGGRIQAQWRLIEHGTPDLLVEGEELSASPVELGSPRLVMHVGNHGATTDYLQVHWPLRASEVCECLQRVCTRIDWLHSQADASLRLMRWPTATQLGGEPHFIRLATLLMSRSMNLAELASRSGVASDTCAAFITAMASHNLLREEPASVPPAPAPISQQGLFARIRRHLGLTEQEQQRA